LTNKAQNSTFKELINLLNSKNIVPKTLEEVDLSLLKTRKKLQIYSGVTENRYYVVIFVIKQKSRFLIKNAKEIAELEIRLEELKNHAYKNKMVVIYSPFCSKAKLFLKTEGWKIIEAKDDTLWYRKP